MVLVEDNTDANMEGLVLDWLLEFYMPATKILVVSGMKEARKPEQLEEGYTGLLRPQLQAFIY